MNTHMYTPMNIIMDQRCIYMNMLMSTVMSMFMERAVKEMRNMTFM